jgi:hypothetical protein
MGILASAVRTITYSELSFGEFAAGYAGAFS